jgi:predicted ATPase
MLIRLELENFKGIASRQRIEFAPLTLLFGANSAGKSTILQALLYLHELLERGSADVDRTELGGNVLELGGFARLVHRHESSRAIVLRVEFATPGGLERFGRDLTDFPFPDLDDEVESAWLELTIRFRTATAFRGPIVDRAVIGVNGLAEPLVWIETGTSLRDGEPLLARVNLGHELLVKIAEKPKVDDASDEGEPSALSVTTEAWEQVAVPEKEGIHGEAEGSGAYGRGEGAGAGLGDGSGFGDGRSLPVFALVRSRTAALPRLDEPLRVVPFGDLEGEREELARLSHLPASEDIERQARRLREAIDLRERAASEVRTFLEMLVLGTTSQLASFLRDAIYIGPLRTIPPRGFLVERVSRRTSWADGLAAWDELMADRLHLVDDANKWLKDLKTNCQIKVQQLFDESASAEELAEQHVDKVARRLFLRGGDGSFVLPSEVGAGISQVIPVLVATLDARSNLLLVEQPEIHVHPAVQIGLGDLFIDAAVRDGGRRTMMVETHSEHLILRVLRRIRETTEGELPEKATAFSPDKISVVYVESGAEGVRIRQLRVDEQGEFKDRWPKGFFAERMEELL